MLKMAESFKYRILLEPNEIPHKWINILPYLKEQSTPMLNPITKKPLEFEMACRIFPKECVLQNNSEELEIEIPKRLREIYSQSYRPSPLQRAKELEKYLGISEEDEIKIFFKNESVSPTGSHKPNTAIAQSYYAKQEGVKELATETGAGQWGSALSYGCSLFDLKCTVFMVRASYFQKPGRKVLMKIFGADVYPSPSKVTEIGKRYLKMDSNHPGSLGLAISEALEKTLSNSNTKYSLGSVVNFVCLHQTIIGQETISQLAKVNIEKPDILIGCMGGGSNFSGLILPFVKNILDDKLSDIEIIGVEPKACPSVTKGEFRWDYGDTGKMGPIVKMHTLGHSFIPHPIHAGGLRYHGMAPIISNLYNIGLMKSKMFDQLDVIKAGLIFARTEGIVPAPETTHAIKEAIDQALKAKEENEKRVIVFNFSGHGFFDLLAYEKYMDGKLENFE
ncbi:MAG: TrpB-like pyridoxal phosphate-dependent enzyme, partial [Candidatus Lokiarchaeota archaeon]